jgi:lauroyl/myristoyl acyltransferase
VAPLYRRVEDAELAERVQIPLGQSLAYLDTLADRLAANRCVSIFGEHPGRQNVEVDILGVKRRLALGAPSIAWRAGAGLVTVYALRESAFRHRVVIEEEMPVDSEMGRREFAEQSVRAFARRLEACVLRHPAQWHGWFYQP